MNDRNDDTDINVDDTIISAAGAHDDTILDNVDLTVQGLDEDTSLTLETENTTVGGEETLLTDDHTVVPDDTTSVYGTLVGSLLDEEQPENDVSPLQEHNTGEKILSVRHSDGRVFSLEKPVVLGRIPTAPRTARDSVTLVALESPGKLVSSTHVRIEQVGTFAVVSDLGSQNGTIIRFPGKPELTLGAHQSLTVDVHCLIDVGDNNRLEILP